MRKLPQSSASEERTGRAIRPPTRYSSPMGAMMVGSPAKWRKRFERPVGLRFWMKLIVPRAWSMLRSWVWIEIGAAWSRAIPVVVVLFGMDLADLEKSGQGRAILEDINVVHLTTSTIT